MIIQARTGLTRLPKKVLTKLMEKEQYVIFLSGKDLPKTIMNNNLDLIGSKCYSCLKTNLKIIPL